MQSDNQEEVLARRKNMIRMLVRERKNSKITQETLAARMGIARANLSRFERGELNSSLDYLMKYAMALGKSVDFVLKNDHKAMPVEETTNRKFIGVNMKRTEMLAKIDDYKRLIGEHRPLSVAEIREYDNYLRIGLTYSSNAMEGNTLTLSETKVILEDGLTVGGKPLRDCYEATGHAAAFDFMMTLTRDESLSVTEEIIRNLHRLFYEKIDSSVAGQYRDHQVFITGTEYIPPRPEDIPEQMEDFICELEIKKQLLHPVELAAFAHRRLVDIHPFADGNGRTARLLMNMILINRGYQPVTIAPVLRLEYYDALRAAQRAEKPTDQPFFSLIAECENEAQREYCRMFGIRFQAKSRDDGFGDRDER